MNSQAFCRLKARDILSRAFFYAEQMFCKGWEIEKKSNFERKIVDSAENGRYNEYDWRSLFFQ